MFVDTQTSVHRPKWSSMSTNMKSSVPKWSYPNTNGVIYDQTASFMMKLSKLKWSHPYPNEVPGPQMKFHLNENEVWFHAAVAMFVWVGVGPNPLPVAERGHHSEESGGVSCYSVAVTSPVQIPA